MLVEINLLPQKEPKKYNFIITLSCLLVVFVLIAGFYFWQTQSIKDELASIDSQISMTKKITEKEEQKSKRIESSSSVGQLKSAIEWAENYPIQTIPVMRHLTSLLPERGFIQSFGYTEEGTITLTVQFDSAREAAYFLEHLNQSKWIEDASLSSLSAAADTNKTTSDGSTTGSTTNTTNQPNTTDQNQSTTGQDPNGATADAGNQTNTAAGTAANQNNNTTADPNTGNNPSNAATTSGTTVSENTNILPRYSGQFEIKLNKAFVKENIKKSKKDEKGVAGS
ncbi:hypothetical protein QNH20_19805 [Neobacillus sp. WH10]|uniref:PilN domain-containing protein n=1 Tax=Neobacillus sp. WH10 TaxID=3047873 RepID=UPI0024C166C5|nr:PilN domain-containing protein [Neobacillus sp. WH10]WHY76348.1 hypothetical protein QNH20_19805 [Neobacillus sp. WH10]